MTQSAAILSHLQAGYTLTPADAYQRFSTLAMHSRIAELRERGWPIICVMVETPNGKRVGCYSLPESHIVRHGTIDRQAEMRL